MNKKGLFIVWLTFLLTVTTLLMNCERVNAQEIQTIRIHGGSALSVGDIYLEPEVLWIAKNGTVVWTNLARTPKVEILFKEGKKCQTATSAPTGFTYDAAQECYVTRLIPFGGTASLKFNENGTYEYMVREKAESVEVKAKGKIIVHE